MRRQPKKVIDKLIRVVFIAVALCATLAPQLVAAQTFPTKPVRLIVPFAPGGPTDIIARLVAQKLQEVWGQPVIVDYKPGAGTIVGTDFVAKSAPDGYTMGMAISAHMINPSLQSSLPYDTLKDLVGVSEVAEAAFGLFAHPSLQANNIPELIALAKKSPGKITYATPGTGTGTHLAVELFKSVAGIDIVHVPYKGSSPAQQDVISGRVDLLSDVLFAAMPLVKAGKLKVIAVASPQRVSYAREYPTIAETLPEVSAKSIIGIVMPSRTPRELVRRVSADIAKTVKSPDLAERMSQLGMEPIGSTPEEYDALIRSEIEKWAKVVKASGAKASD